MSEIRPWMRGWLRAAAVYNLLWGGAVVLFPAVWFEVAGLEPPRYLSIWQCVGMIVGVYGVGYWLAAGDPLRHWPIVLVGLLGKVFGPIGFVGAAVQGELPWRFGWTIVTNDLIWWVPFSMILWRAFSAHSLRQSAKNPEGEVLVDATTAMLDMRTQHGVSVADLSESRPQLVVFLRHAGCIFCQEALADVADRRDEIHRSGAGIVLVHMGADADLLPSLERHGLTDVPRVADPSARSYRAFELGRGGFRQLFGWRTWWRGAAAYLRGHRVGKLAGDGFRMPGTFVVSSGRIVAGYRHRSAADRPDYVSLVRGAVDGARSETRVVRRAAGVAGGA